jgi:hypothetical protein
VWARPYVLRALAGVLGRDPYAAEVYALQGVTRLESYYGAGWRSPPHAPDMVASLNMGAVQCTKHWAQFGTKPAAGPMPNLQHHVVPSAVPGCCALAVDSRPAPDGKTRLWYVGPYRCYADPTEAFAHVARILLRMNVIGSASASVTSRTFRSVSTRMFEARYYEGPPGSREEKIAYHETALSRNCAAISKALAEQPGLGQSPVPERVIQAPPTGPALPGPLPVIEADDDNIAAIAADLARRVIRESRS